MTLLSRVPSARDDLPAAPTGEVRFVRAEERDAWPTQHALSGLLFIELPSPPWLASPTGGPLQRGKLRDVIEWAIEDALTRLGAPSPGVGEGADLDQSLSDHLYRARLRGVSGFALMIPDLGAASNLAGALDADDSAVLRWWLAATKERPVVLLLDEANRRIGAYGPPTRLDRLVEQGSPPAVRGRVVRDHEEGHEGSVDPDPREAPLELAEGGTATELERSEERVLHEAVEATKAPSEEGPAAEAADVPAPPAAPALVAHRVVPLFPRRVPPAERDVAESTRAAAPSVDWRMLASDLESAKGPKPLAIVERLFMTRYTPLLEALAGEEPDEAARRTVEQWAESFARSYTESFSALKVTGKRPRMVLDAPQLCQQIARLHGAKSTLLVLVDGMRFDVGVRVHDRMRDALTSQATCTERLLLWSALPTTTPAQLDLMAHGPEGLTSRTGPVEREEPGVRGRTSSTLRRVKVGNRDVLKLDTIEARLRESGPPLSERLDLMADEVAAALSAHARSLAPRTLMFVFGDHGFRMDTREGVTRGGTQGGASPEEVLVPALAWLVGDVH